MTRRDGERVSFERPLLTPRQRGERGQSTPSAMKMASRFRQQVFSSRRSHLFHAGGALSVFGADCAISTNIYTRDPEGLSATN
jgi:hypothetical protein